MQHKITFSVNFPRPLLLLCWLLFSFLQQKWKNGWLFWSTDKVKKWFFYRMKVKEMEYIKTQKNFFFFFLSFFKIIFSFLFCFEWSTIYILGGGMKEHRKMPPQNSCLLAQDTKMQRIICHLPVHASNISNFNI